MVQLPIDPNWNVFFEKHGGSKHFGILNIRSYTNPEVLK